MLLLHSSNLLTIFLHCTNATIPVKIFENNNTRKMGHIIDFISCIVVLLSAAWSSLHYECWQGKRKRCIIFIMFSRRKVGATGAYMLSQAWKNKNSHPQSFPNFHARLPHCEALGRLPGDPDRPLISSFQVRPWRPWWWRGVRRCRRLPGGCRIGRDPRCSSLSWPPITVLFS